MTHRVSFQLQPTCRTLGRAATALVLALALALLVGSTSLLGGAREARGQEAGAGQADPLVDGRHGNMVREVSHRVQARVHGLVVETEVTVALRSTSGGDEEGILTFGVPPGGTVTDLWYKAGPRFVRGALLPADAVRRSIGDSQGLPPRADPAWLETIGPDRYRLRVHPVPSSGAAEVRYRYLHPVSVRWGQRVFVYPRRGRTKRLAPAVITLEDHSPFRRGSARHTIRVPSESTLERPLADPVIPPDAPLRAALYVASGSAPQVGYGAILLQGNPEASRRRWGTDVVFLVDHSRSMWDGHVKGAEAVVRGVLKELGPNTRFGLVAFHRTAVALAKGLTGSTAKEMEEALGALRRLPAQNGTSLVGGLSLGYRLLGTGRTARRRLLVVLTDGLLPDREHRDAAWPSAPAGTELLFLVGRPHRGLSHRLRQGAIAELAAGQGGLAYAFDPHQDDDGEGQAASLRATGALAASLARPGRLKDLRVTVDGTLVPLPHRELTLLGGLLVFHKSVGLPRQAVVELSYWGQRRRIEVPARSMPVAWARHVRAISDEGARDARGVSETRSLVVVHPDDPFGRDRLAFAQRWGGRFFQRMAPVGAVDLPVGPFHLGAQAPVVPAARAAGKGFQEGRLTKGIVRNMISGSYLKLATLCYQATGPEFKEGRAMLHMDLTRGEITDAWIDHSTMGNQSLHRCLVEAAHKLMVARSWGDETLYRVTYPMRFRPADRSVGEARGWRPPPLRARPNPLEGLRD